VINKVGVLAHTVALLLLGSMKKTAALVLRTPVLALRVQTCS
jgi:hypothetical protein